MYINYVNFKIGLPYCATSLTHSRSEDSVFQLLYICVETINKDCICGMDGDGWKFHPLYRANKGKIKVKTNYGNCILDYKSLGL